MKTEHSDLFFETFVHLIQIWFSFIYKILLLQCISGTCLFHYCLKLKLLLIEAIVALKNIRQEIQKQDWGFTLVVKGEERGLFKVYWKSLIKTIVQNDIIYNKPCFLNMFIFLSPFAVNYNHLFASFEV